MVYFVTGSEHKLAEAQAIIPDLEQLDVDLPEIQELNPRAVIQAKLDEAAKLKPEGSFVVEDTSLCLDALNDFPGTLIKWMLKSVGVQGIYDIANQAGNRQATARTVIGYLPPNGTSVFFEGTLMGTIVAPEGESGFGFDPIFQPDGFNATFAEMDKEEKTQFSMRTEAFRKLKEYLDRSSN